MKKRNCFAPKKIILLHFFLSIICLRLPAQITETPPDQISVTDTSVVADSTSGEDTAQTAEKVATVKTIETAAAHLNISISARIHIFDTTSVLPYYDSTPMLRLTISEAISLLLQNNPDICRARLEWRAGTSKLAGAYGIFEPAIIGNVKHETSNRPYTLYGQLQNIYSSGLEGLLPSATKYEMNFNVTDLRYRFPDNTSLPYTFLNFSLTQPLLKGLWLGKPVIDIRVARAEREISLQKYRAAIFSKLFELEIAYWKLCLAQEKLRYALHSVAIAREIVDDSRIQLRAEKISELDAVEAAAALAARQNDGNDAHKDLLTAINELKLLVAGHGSLIDTLLYASSNVQIGSSDSIGLNYCDDTVDFKKLQPDYLQKKNEFARGQISVTYQTSQCLPELNLKGSYGYLVTGRQTDIVWHNFLSTPYRTRSGSFSAEIEFRIPLGMNIRERKLLDAEKLNLSAMEASLFSIQTQIENYLFASRKRMGDLRTNLSNARIVIDYRTSLLQAEIVKQQNGKSSYRKIFEVEEELTKSKQWEIENIIDYRSLKVQIARLTGTMLLDRSLETFVNNTWNFSPDISAGR